MKYVLFLRVIVTLIFCQLSGASFAQEDFISGIIIDSDTDEPLAFTNLGVKSKWKGTVSTIEGKFTLSTYGLSELDTLEISKLGFKKETFIIADLALQNQEPLIIKLKSTLLDLPEFTVESLVVGNTRTFGSLPKSSIFAFAFSPQNVPFTESFGREITISINPKSEKLLLDTIKINFSRLEVDSLTLRVNAYKDQDGKPGEKFFESLWQIENQGINIYEFSLRDLSMKIEQKSFVSIELIHVDDQKKFGIITIPVSISLGNHFVRLSSLGAWTKAKGNPAIQVILKEI